MKKLLVYLVTIVMYLLIIAEAIITGYKFSEIINKIDLNDD